jgi:pyrroline-5-carboxylate reductase
MTLNTLTTQAQVDEVLAPSTKYPEAAYAEVITALAKSGKKVRGAERLEESFVGVKPQHVAHMLKRLLGDDESLIITITATRGVCAVKA